MKALIFYFAPAIILQLKFTIKTLDRQINTISFLVFFQLPDKTEELIGIDI